MKFLKYHLTANRLCIGERTKGGRYKPTVKTLRYSQLCGDLKYKFGMINVHAIGVLEQYKVEYLSYTLKDRSRDISKLPLRVEFLTGVTGTVYISEGSIPGRFEQGFRLLTGAMISKGFGESNFLKVGEVDTVNEMISKGFLNTRIPINAQNEKELEGLVEQGIATQFLADTFGINKVLKPKLGYLFNPVNNYTGNYILALFEDSKIEGCKFLLKEGD